MKKSTLDKLKNYTCTGQYSFTDPDSFNRYVEEYQNSKGDDTDAENQDK